MKKLLKRPKNHRPNSVKHLNEHRYPLNNMTSSPLTRSVERCAKGFPAWATEWGCA